MVHGAAGRRRALLRYATLTAVLVLGLAQEARADATDKAAAEALFSEARTLMDQGRYAEACEKLEQSEAVEVAVGTLLNLGSCYEELGRTASAWVAYRRAAALARSKDQEEREAFARDHAAALEPGLARLSIQVARDVPRLSVVRGDVPVPPSVWGQAVPVDPGEYEVVATAPGKKTWTSRVKAAPGKTIVVQVPVLADDEPPPERLPVAPAPDSPPPRPPPVAPARDESASTQRTVAYVLGGVGVVGLGVGGAFLIRALSKDQESRDYCASDDPNRCQPRGKTLRDEATAAGNVATVAGGVGALALVGAAVLYFTEPGGSGVRVGARVGPTAAELGVNGSF